MNEAARIWIWCGAVFVTLIFLRDIYLHVYPALRRWLVDRSYRAYQKRMEKLRPAHLQTPPVQQRSVSARIELAQDRDAATVALLLGPCTCPECQWADRVQREIEAMTGGQNANG